MIISAHEHGFMEDTTYGGLVEAQQDIRSLLTELVKLVPNISKNQLLELTDSEKQLVDMHTSPCDKRGGKRYVNLGYYGFNNESNL